MRRGESKYLRTITYRRDGGVCAKCGLDTEKLIDIAAEADLRPSFVQDTDDPHIILAKYWTEKFGQAARDTLWDADHVISVEEWPEDMPGLNSINNLQTLCLHCHPEKTADHAARRAKRRKQRKKEGPKARQMRQDREEQA